MRRSSAEEKQRTPYTGTVLQTDRFITPQEGWADRMGEKLCVPNQWALMLIDIPVNDAGAVRMSSVVGISATSVEYKKTPLETVIIDRLERKATQN